MDVSSVLNSVQDYDNNAGPSGGSSPRTTASSSSTTDFDQMTISQIRDTTDQMAIEGKLTGQQQLTLIGDGLQDLNAADPSYQPSDNGIGYSRADTGTYNLVDMMNGAADFAAAADNNQSAATYKGIADAVQSFEHSPTGSNIIASA